MKYAAILFFAIIGGTVFSGVQAAIDAPDHGSTPLYFLAGLIIGTAAGLIGTAIGGD